MTESNDDKYNCILNATLKLESLKGHMKWTMADLSRSSGIGRTLIYYYFGKSKDEIVGESVRGIARNVFALDGERSRAFSKNSVKQSILHAREFVFQCPHALEFYFRWRGTATYMGEILRDTEAAYFKKLEKVAGKLKKHEREAIYCGLIGLVVSPTVSEDAIDMILDRLL